MLTGSRALPRPGALVAAYPAFPQANVNGKFTDLSACRLTCSFLPGFEGVPLENRIWLLACGFVVASGGSAVFIDQPVQNGFSADSLAIEVDCGDAGSFAVTAGDPLGDALMRPGRVVVDLVLDQDGAQMRLTEDQHAVEELAAQGTEQAFAGRVHPRSLDSGLQDPGAACLEDGVEGLAIVRADSPDSPSASRTNVRSPR